MFENLSALVGLFGKNHLYIQPLVKKFLLFMDKNP